MAYRAFGADALAIHGPSDSARPGTGRAEAPFAPLELEVIAIAEADPVATIGAPTRFTRFFERWFGLERSKPLANARLEALRRFAVLARVTAGRLPAEEVKRFVTAGFTPRQARVLQRRAALAH